LPKTFNATLSRKSLKNVAFSALEDAASVEKSFVRLCREILGKRGSSRKRKPSAKIFESLNKMLGQIVQQKQQVHYQ
jgi:hypothetical protein